MSEVKSEKPSKFIVVHASGEGNPGLGYAVRGFGADLRLAKKDAAAGAPVYAKPGDKVLVYELRWASTAQNGEIVLVSDPVEEGAPEPEPKSDPAPAQALTLEGAA
jgi:hypothetical protein